MRHTNTKGPKGGKVTPRGPKPKWGRLAFTVDMIKQLDCVRKINGLNQKEKECSDISGSRAEAAEEKKAQNRGKEKSGEK